VGIAVKNYRAALERFKASLATSANLQQSKSMMNDKTSMSATHHPQPIAIESHGEFHIIMADGRKLSGQDAAQLTEDDEASLVTGSDGGAVLKLSDGTRITLGSNTELRTKAPDPAAGPGKQPLPELVNGVLRWLHEIKHELNESAVQGERERRHKGVRMPHVVVAKLGTHFECAVLPDGSEYIKLYSGAIDLIPDDGGKILKLKPGQMVTIQGGKLSKPMPIR
jgi:ferric-dicitrate binding protein FerR (iron transport regulator)